MRRLKSFKPEDIGRIVDALRYSLYVINFTFNELTELTNDFSQGTQKKLPLRDSIRATVMCWAIVDHCRRSAQLSRALLRYSDSFRTDLENSIDEFIRVAESCRLLRNLFHHLEEKVKKLPPEAPSITGTLSWYQDGFSKSCFTLFLHSGALSCEYPSLTYDRKNDEFTENYVFFSGDQSVSLMKVYNVSILLADEIEKYISKIDAYDSGDVAASLIFVKFDNSGP